MNSPTPTLPAASWLRRFTALIYEMLLTGALLLVLAGIFNGLFQLLTGQPVTALSQSWLAQALHFGWLFGLTGLYFVFCWRKSGQTLAMRTWRCQLQDRHGQAPSLRQCLIRYVVAALCYVLVLPAWLLARHDAGWLPLAWLATGLVLLPWCWAFIARDRQLLQDALAGTRIVLLPKGSRAASSAKPDTQ
ncbi:RDD family protein [Chitinilyticum litopenaei]|uniref:RDD family protein n=1 Tax=Chitinilyticum litopenaei TaxID=1121276 RepID=UPI0011852FF3|nr:RDD family protein [Chitinilyticum litopenaei]